MADRPVFLYAAVYDEIEAAAEGRRVLERLSALRARFPLE